MKGYRVRKPKKCPCDDCWRKAWCTTDCNDFKHFVVLGNRGMSGKEMRENDKRN